MTAHCERLVITAALGVTDPALPDLLAGAVVFAFVVNGARRSFCSQHETAKRSMCNPSSR